MKDKSKDPVSFEELVVSNMLQQEALLRILQRKGIITMEELLDELKKLREEHANISDKDIENLLNSDNIN